MIWIWLQSISLTSQTWQADDGCWPALCWPGRASFRSSSVLGPSKCPGANSCRRWGRKAWQEQAAAPASQWSRPNNWPLSWERESGAERQKWGWGEKGATVTGEGVRGRGGDGGRGKACSAALARSWLLWGICQTPLAPEFNVGH